MEDAILQLLYFKSFTWNIHLLTVLKLPPIVSHYGLFTLHFAVLCDRQSFCLKKSILQQFSRKSNHFQFMKERQISIQYPCQPTAGGRLMLPLPSHPGERAVTGARSPRSIRLLRAAACRTLLLRDTYVHIAWQLLA